MCVIWAKVLVSALTLLYDMLRSCGSCLFNVEPASQTVDQH